MSKRLVLLSTGVGLVPVLVSKVKEFDSTIDIFNIVDDSIVNTISSNNNMVPASINARIADYCRIAEEMQADALLLTCSSISETLDSARPLTNVPLFKIDEPMAEAAVKQSNSAVGVVATLLTTLQPTKRLIESKIKKFEKDLEIKTHLCSGAFEANLAGDVETHDRMVRDGVEKLLKTCDYVVLAQASMARAVASMDKAASSRVLTSPELGIEPVVRYLQGRDSSTADDKNS